MPDLKITIERAALLSALSHGKSIVERRNTIPILSNVLLKAEGDTLYLTATDMDIEIIDSCPCVVTTPGTLTVPAHTLLEIVGKLADGAQILLESNDSGQLMVKSGRSKFMLGVLPAEDFPTMGKVDAMVTFDIPASDLGVLIDRTRFAMSTEETRYYLCGVYLHYHAASSTLRGVATDGHRMARVEATLPEGADKMHDIILPRKCVAEVRKLLDSAAGAVTMSVSSHKVRFEVSGIILTSKLIDGTFPDYERVIPAGNDKALLVDSCDFARAVDRVSTVSDEKGNAIKLAISNGLLTLSAKSHDAGSGEDELDAEYDSSDMELGINGRYLKDVLGQIGGKKVHFLMKDAASPVIVTDPEDATVLYIVMPVRI